MSQIDIKTLIDLFKESMGVEATEKIVYESIENSGLPVKMFYTNKEYIKICDVLKKRGGFIKTIATIASTTAYQNLVNRQKEETALRESYNIISRSPVVVFLWRNITGWPVEFVSENVLKVFGYTVEELTSSKILYSKIIHPDDLKRVSKEINVYSKGKKRKEFNQIYRVITKDGKVKWIDDRKYIRRDNKGRVAHYQGTILDITKRKKIEEQLIGKTAEIRELLRQKDEFIGQLGHDLKTPLSIILNFLPTIKEEIKNPHVKKDCEVTIRNANYIKKLVMETLKIAELSSPNVKLDINDANLLEIVDKVIHDNQLVFKKKETTIENNIDEKIIVKIDSLQIKEVFDNLITNAVKFMSEGGRLMFDTEESKDKDYVTISVKDTGIGMEPGQLIHIRHDPESSGLGLSICKRIVERHNGHIWAESIGMGKGTTIYFTLKRGNMKEFGKK